MLFWICQIWNQTCDSAGFDVVTPNDIEKQDNDDKFLKFFLT